MTHKLQCNLVLPGLQPHFLLLFFPHIAWLLCPLPISFPAARSPLNIAVPSTLDAVLSFLAQDAFSLSLRFCTPVFPLAGTLTSCLHQTIYFPCLPPPFPHHPLLLCSVHSEWLFICSLFLSLSLLNPLSWVQSGLLSVLRTIHRAVHSSSVCDNYLETGWMNGYVNEWRMKSLCLRTFNFPILHWLSTQSYL